MVEQMPVWLYFWLVPLVLTNLAAALFIVGRKEGRWIFRIEALAIVVAFLVAAQVMEWIYAELGYVRLLGVRKTPRRSSAGEVDRGTRRRGAVEK